MWTCSLRRRHRPRPGKDHHRRARPQDSPHRGHPRGPAAPATHNDQIGASSMVGPQFVIIAHIGGSGSAPHGLPPAQISSAVILEPRISIHGARHSNARSCRRSDPVAPSMAAPRERWRPGAGIMQPWLATVYASVVPRTRCQIFRRDNGCMWARGGGLRMRSEHRCRGGWSCCHAGM
jgi:hypothetical protein